MMTFQFLTSAGVVTFNCPDLMTSDEIEFVTDIITSKLEAVRKRVQRRIELEMMTNARASSGE